MGWPHWATRTRREARMRPSTMNARVGNGSSFTKACPPAGARDLGKKLGRALRTPSPLEDPELVERVRERVWE